MVDTYIIVLYMLNTREPSDETIFLVLARLDATIESQGKICDCLFGFIATGNTLLLEAIKKVCRQEIFHWSLNNTKQLPLLKRTTN